MNTLGPSVPVQPAKSNARGEGVAVDGAGFADAFDGAFSALGPRTAPSADTHPAPVAQAAPSSRWAETGPQPSGSKQVPSQAAKTDRVQSAEDSGQPYPASALPENGSLDVCSVTQAPAAATTSLSAPAAHAGPRAETFSQDLPEATRPPSRQGAPVDGKAKPGVASPSVPSPGVALPIDRSPEGAPQSASSRGPAIEAAPAVNAAPSGGAPQARDASDASTTADEVLSRAAADSGTRVEIPNRVPTQAGKPAGEQGAFVNREVSPGAASPKTARGNAPSRAPGLQPAPAVKAAPPASASQARDASDASAVVDAALSAPAAKPGSRAEAPNRVPTQAGKPAVGQGAFVNREVSPGVASPGVASQGAYLPEAAHENAPSRGPGLQPAPAVKGSPSSSASKARDASDASAVVDAALSAPAAKPGSRAEFPNRVPSQASKPVGEQGAFVSRKGTPDFASPDISSPIDPSPEGAPQSVSLRGAAPSAVSEVRGATFAKAPQAPGAAVEAATSASATKVGPHAETLRQNPPQTSKPASGQSVYVNGEDMPGVTSRVASPPGTAPENATSRGAPPSAVPEIRGVPFATAPQAQATAAESATSTSAARAGFHIEGLERTPGQGGRSAEVETPTATPKSLEAVPPKASDGPVVRDSGALGLRQEVVQAAAEELKGQPAGLSTLETPKAGSVDTQVGRAGIDRDRSRLATARTVNDEAAPVRHDVASTEALLKGDTRRGIEVLSREARTPTNLFAGGARSAGVGKASGQPELSGPVASPALERGTLARISFDQRLAQASAQALVARPAEQGASGSSGPNPGSESTAAGHGALTPSFDPRPGTVSPVAVESRLGPALIRDLQQQFASLEEGTSRTVELRLDPPELGRVTVRISMVGDEARVAFTAAQGSAREALEAALPKLREMFEQAGLSLGDAQVGSGSGQDSRGRGRSSEDSVVAKGELAANQDSVEGMAESKEARVNSPARGRLNLRV